MSLGLMLGTVASLGGHPAPLRHGVGAFAWLSGLLIAAAATLTTGFFLRRRPFIVLGLLLVLSLTPAFVPHRWYAALPPLLPVVPPMLAAIAVCFIAATRSTRASIATATITLAMLTISWAHWPASGTRPGPTTLFLGTPPSVAIAVITVIGWLIGHSIRQAHVHAESLRAQARDQETTAERLELARDLHDHVAHTIGVIAIQAGVARRVIDTQPEEARNSLAAIEATSRQTLAGLRHTVGSLRQTGLRSGLPGPAFGPQPGLDDLPQLTETTKRAGVGVDVDWRGERRQIPADVDACAFRIIQEALTNVVRHAGTDRCRVAIEQTDSELAIEITDDGHTAQVNGAGYGITGMRERAALLNGEFAAGPRAEGGFRVVARLPLAAAP